jgi:hypothetical protein
MSIVRKVIFYQLFEEMEGTHKSIISRFTSSTESTLVTVQPQPYPTVTRTVFRAQDSTFIHVYPFRLY